MVTTGKGHVAYNPGRHCLDILNSGEFRMDQYIHLLKQMSDYKELRVTEEDYKKLDFLLEKFETRCAVIKQLF